MRQRKQPGPATEPIDPAIFHDYLRVENDRLVWTRSISRHRAGDPAGLIAQAGYWVVNLKGRRYMAHRVIWAMAHGRWPAVYLDHINGIKTDNRIENLRECNYAQNTHNSKPRNSLKLKGVAHSKNGQRFQVFLHMKYVGTYDTKEEAAQVYDREAKKLYGDFARLNNLETTA